MSPTTLYDPEIITSTPTVGKFERRARPLIRPRKPFDSSKLMAALLVVPSMLVIFVLMAVFAELALALVGLGDDEYIKADPILGITHLENKWVDFRHEGFSRAKISSAGLRDVEHQVAKPAGVKRIAFIGDSKTQALQVSIEDTFARLVEDNLNGSSARRVSAGVHAETDSRRFETINFGMSNYGLVQYFVQFLFRVRQYSPDVTVVVYHIFDSSENLPKFGTLTMPAPTLSLNNRDELALDFTFLDGWLNTESGRYMIASQWLRRNCHLFQALSADDFMLRNSSKWYTNISGGLFAPFSNLYDDVMRTVSLTKFGDYQSTRNSLSDETRDLDKQVSHENIWNWTVKARRGGAGSAGAFADQGDSYKLLHDAAKSDVNLAGRVLRMLNLACKKAGSKLVIVTLPAPNNMVFYFREIECLKKLGEKEGITIIDANAEFPSLAPMQPSPLYYRSHFSPSGHQKLADIVTEGLKPILE
ncbi:MAG: hypothetical protein IT342_12590 [Candidatus Melainabacteria bacterium]|nr:hypothetical protein [Candidatus Melainabacteria bacterium]